MSKEPLAFAIVISSLVLLVIGWFRNLYLVALALFSSAELTGELMIQIIAVFIVPLGMILGWVF